MLFKHVPGVCTDVPNNTNKTDHYQPAKLEPIPESDEKPAESDDVGGDVDWSPKRLLERRIACEWTPLRLSLYVKDLVSKVFIFASNDGRTILVSHPLGKVLVHNEKISAVFYLEDELSRFLTIDESITLHDKTLSEYKVARLFHHPTGGAACDRSQLDINLLTAEFLYEKCIQHENWCTTQETAEPIFDIRREHFTYTVRDYVKVALKDNFQKVHICTPHAFIATTADDIYICILNGHGQVSQSVCFDGADIRVFSKCIDIAQMNI